MPGLRTTILIVLAVVVAWELVVKHSPWTIDRWIMVIAYILILVFLLYARMTGLTIPWDLP